MDIQSIINQITEQLRKVNGVSAIVLGGSRARGTHHPGSDIDIGIYYDSSEGLDIEELRRISADLDDDGRKDLLTEIGGWGPWINGGGWLRVEQIPVDFLYRDIRKVSRIIDDCLNGNITIDYQPGHPHGFINSIYLAEIALCQVLWDPSGIISALKPRTAPFPAVYRQAIIGKFLWEAKFSLEIGMKGVVKKDASYVGGCCFRAVSCLNQVLFAINNQYCMNEKGAAAIIDGLDIVPTAYAERINQMFTLISADAERLKEALDILGGLVHETERLITSAD
ncbi:nucleotidyltransferase family protein [Paenibacillus sp. XY044]|uniref:nucleotidyltransferase family protein n=1 Tax=Paenibacillus sp. XY044 TaxID=2026089 RepID=UPI000B98B889|nr:nucleotidyltransferase domain-containing protein [Paenibacillus sp. XY044]OZB98788.1 DNA polymerase subunit beta [Paenibacillus sp. XY044]